VGKSSIDSHAPTRAQWVAAVFMLACSAFLGWIFLLSLRVLLLYTHYQASVIRCSGGRRNKCDIVVHTRAGDVQAVANLGSSRAGQVARVAVRGHPPTWTVWNATNTASAWLIFATTLIGCMLCLLLALYSLLKRPHYPRYSHATRRGKR
jgi:hypothetical protein